MAPTAASSTKVDRLFTKGLSAVLSVLITKRAKPGRSRWRSGRSWRRPSFENRADALVVRTVRAFGQRFARQSLGGVAIAAGYESFDAKIVRLRRETSVGELAAIAIEQRQRDIGLRLLEGHMGLIDERDLGRQRSRRL